MYLKKQRFHLKKSLKNVLVDSLQAASAPQISFDAEEGSLWTLLLTCPGEPSLHHNTNL